MARMSKRPKKEEGDELEAEFMLPEKFVPSYTAAIPEWASNVSKELARKADLKGSPGFDPGPEQALQVEQMSALGMSPMDISSVLRIEPKLLEKFYKYELETATSRINHSVAKVALQMALSGTTPDMTKFWLKTRAGWKETKAVELTGQGGGPIEFQEIKRRMIESIEAEVIDVEYTDVKSTPRSTPEVDE